MDEASVNTLVKDLISEAHTVQSQRDFDVLKSKYLGSKSVIKGCLHSLSTYHGAEKAEKSKLFNAVRMDLQNALSAIKNDLDQKNIQNLK